MWSDLSNLVFTCVCIHMWKSPDIFRWQFLPLTMFETGSLLQLWSCQDSWPRSFERFCCLHLLSGLPVLLCLVFSWHAEQTLYTVHLLACNIVIFFFSAVLKWFTCFPLFFWFFLPETYMIPLKESNWYFSVACCFSLSLSIDWSYFYHCLLFSSA